MRLLTISFLALTGALSAVAQTADLPAAPPSQAPAARKADTLHQLSDSIQGLSDRVHRSVVQVFSTGYALAEESEEGAGRSTGLVTKQRSTGSGVIVSQDGYIVTNNHVVQGARTVRVQLTFKPEIKGQPADSHRNGKLVEARVVGMDREADLAVLKIDAGSQLPSLALGNSDDLHQGQMVLAFGNPLGLENSVSLGVVSSVGRQIKPDDPMVYIQTDAPINPGNSGGPLLNVDGEVVGINTFILSQSGGSEGIGFAIPSNIVANVYKQIVKSGHVHRGEIGVRAQSITPELAAGLSLKQDWGVVLGDVLPDTPAADAGVKVGDVVTSLNGRQTTNARQFEIELYRTEVGQTAKMELLRGTEKIMVDVKVREREDDPFRFIDLVKPETNLVAKLGIIGIPITKEVASILPETRFPYGVIVAARSGGSDYSGQGGLNVGDVIYAVNTRPMATLEALRQAVDGLKAADPLVLQIERDGKLMFLTLSEE